MKVRLLQCLCPQRHAIVGMTVQDPTVTDAKAMDMLKTCVQVVLAGRGAEFDSPQIPDRMNPWCGLCGAAASTWHYELSVTRKDYPTYEAAVADIQACERQQRLSALFLTLLNESFDSKLRG